MNDYTSKFVMKFMDNTLGKGTNSEKQMKNREMENSLNTCGRGRVSNGEKGGGEGGEVGGGGGRKVQMHDAIFIRER